MQKLINAWPVLTGLFFATVAIGSGYQKIETLEEAVKIQTEQQQVVVEIQTQQAAQEAKIDMMIEIIKEMNRKMKP